MAGNGDIRQKIVLEGEKEYSNSIKEAQRNLKTLRSELKAETAELGKNATEQQKTEVKTKNLQKQIKEQEKIVKANRDALEEVRKKYGDNADAVAKYEQKLNESRAALANMKNQLESTGDGFKKLSQDADTATVAAKSVADTIGNLADVGNAIADSIEGIFTGMLDTIKQAVGEVWQLIAETAAKANSWTDLANAYGTTAEKVQRMTKGLEWSGGSFEDLMTIIQKTNWGGSKKEKLLTNALGISDANYTDKLDYTMLVLSKLKELKEKNPKSFDSIIENVYGGKQGTKLSWFIDNWDTIQAKLNEYDESQFGMDKDELETMNQVYVELQTIEGKWDSLKEKFAAGFGTITLDIMTNVNGALDALSKYFNAETEEERQKALDDLEKNIIEAFDKVKTAIETGLAHLNELAESLKQSDNPTVQAIGNILDGIVKALQWFTEDNMRHVVDALELLAVFWVGGRAAGMIAQITEFAAQIAILKGAGLFGGLAGSATGAASALSNIGLTVGSLAITAATVTLIASAFSWAADRRNNHPEEVRGTNENLATTAAKTALAEDLAEYIEAKAEFQKLLEAGTLDDEKAQELLGKFSAFEAKEGAADLLSAYSDWRQENSYGNMDWVLPADWGEISEEAADAFAEAVAEEFADLEPEVSFSDEDRESAIQDFFDAWREGADDLESATEWVQEVFGDEWDAVFAKILKEWDSLTPKQQNSLEDIPADWWSNTGELNSNIEGLRGVPGLMKAAVREGVSGIRVTMDGQAVGNIVAPYVSEQIARDMV